jgi:putative DNA primase/helicase
MTAGIDFATINSAALRNGRSLVQDLIPGGKFRSLEYVVKNPCRNDERPGSFTINYRDGVWKDFATDDGGSDFISLVAYVKGLTQGEAAHDLATKLGVPPAKSNGFAREHTANGNNGVTPPHAPKIFQWGDDGPPKRADEVRRHVYRSSDCPLRIKIKLTDGKYVQWYRAFGADGLPIGWQSRKPADYRSIPYVTHNIDPFDSELIADEILWPEGEKDVDSLSGVNLPGFTFGGVGDGLPDDIAEYLKGRKIVILADNDDPGRAHAEKKAAAAHAAGAAAIKVLHFPELPPKSDISDFIGGGGTAEQLLERIDDAPLWLPLSLTRAETTPLSNLETPALISRCAADIVPEKIESIWLGRIARGKHTCVAGEPGTGKSQLSIAISATVTRGAEWPCGEGRAPLGNVIMLSAEDGAADTIVPRLLAAGADLDRVHVVSAVRDAGGGRRALNLQNDVALLEQKIAEVGDVALVVIDPVSSYLGRADSHKNSEVRAVLEPLSEMAERTRVAILSITHFSKAGSNSTTKALHRFIGSIAFTGAPRAAFAVIEDAEQEGRRLFLHAKNNLAPAPQGLAFRLEQTIVGGDIVASRISWDGESVTITANEAMAADAGGTQTRNAVVEATEFLETLLADGPLPATQVKVEADAAGHSWATVKRAKKTAGIDAFREGGTGDKGRWLWRLHGPESLRGSSNSYVAQETNVSPLAKVEPLSRVDPNSGALQ